MIRGQEAAFWSVLPPLSLLGLGTPFVESVDHYVARIAWVIGSTEGKILDLCDPAKVAVPRVAAFPGSFSGADPRCRERIRRLEALTGVDSLRCGSLCALSELLTSRAFGRNSSARRWCPRCFKDWDEVRSWEPLQWMIGLRVTCPVHGCDLEEKCRHCGAVSSTLDHYPLRRNCSACGKSLGHEGLVTRRSKYEIWVESQLDELVCYCATPGSEAIAGDVFDTFVTSLVESISKCGSEAYGVARYLLALDDRKYRKDIWRRVDLKTLINACTLQGVSLMQLLTNPAGSASKPLISGLLHYQSLKVKHVSEPKRVRALTHCLTGIFNAYLTGYLPDPQFAMRQFCIDRPLAKAMCGKIIDQYEDRYYAQGSLDELRSQKSIFAYILSRMTANGLNPFVELDVSELRRAVVKAFGISRGHAQQMVAYAIFWRRSVERAKAQLLGLSDHELFAHLD